MKRVYTENVSIDERSIKELYKKRAIEKVSIDVDAPVVLCADRNKDNIEKWTNFEVEHRLPFLQLDKNSVVLEIGCGTGRISKFITPLVSEYVGVDYVEEFINLIKNREDIYKDENTYFLNASVSEIVDENYQLPTVNKFNRFVISGGVLMYINDDELKHCITNIVSLFDENCIVYISEPISIKERLTLNKFYSDNLESEYSAIYRTVDEYQEILKPLYDNGFKLKVSEEFFFEDIKLQKETRQWIFVLEK